MSMNKNYRKIMARRVWALWMERKEQGVKVRDIIAEIGKTLHVYSSATIYKMVKEIEDECNN